MSLEDEGLLNIHGKSNDRCYLRGQCLECRKDIEIPINDSEYDTNEGEREYVFYCHHCGQKYKYLMEVTFFKYDDCDGGY